MPLRKRSCFPASMCLLRQAYSALGDLRIKQEKAAALSGQEQARFYHSEVCPAMQVLRAPVDHLGNDRGRKALADADLRRFAV